MKKPYIGDGTDNKVAIVGMRYCIYHLLSSKWMNYIC